MAIFVVLAAGSTAAFAQSSAGSGSGARTGTDVWQQWRNQRTYYQEKHPCPANGKKSGNCPGYRIGLAVPPRNGGAISQDNMKWMTEEEYAATQQNMPEP